MSHALCPCKEMSSAICPRANTLLMAEKWRLAIAFIVTKDWFSLSFQPSTIRVEFVWKLKLNLISASKHSMHIYCLPPRPRITIGKHPSVNFEWQTNLCHGNHVTKFVRPSKSPVFSQLKIYKAWNRSQCLYKNHGVQFISGRHGNRTYKTCWPHPSGGWWMYRQQLGTLLQNWPEWTAHSDGT